MILGWSFPETPTVLDIDPDFYGVFESLLGYSLGKSRDLLTC